MKKGLDLATVSERVRLFAEPSQEGYGLTGDGPGIGRFWGFLGTLQPFGRSAGGTREMGGPDQIVSIASACGFDRAAAPEKGGAASGATPDNSWLSNHARSVKVAQKTFPGMTRMLLDPTALRILRPLRLHQWM